MAILLLKEVPKYECLLEGAKRFPELDPSATEAFLHLLRTSNDISEDFGAIHASHNISRGRFIVLMLLNHDPERPANPADLANRSNVTRATMTGLIDTLERDGFVRRERAPGDRRIAAVMGQLTEAERKSLVALMGKIQQTLPAIRGGALPKSKIA